MDERDYAMVLGMAANIEIVLHACCMAAFFYPFMTRSDERWRSRMKKLFLVVMIYTTIYFVNALTSVYGWICMMIVLISLAAVSKCLDLDKRFAFFLGVVFFSCKNLVLLVMRSPAYLLSKSLGRRADTAEEVYRRGAWDFILVTALGLLLFSAMLSVSGRLLRKMPKKGQRNLCVKELCYLLLIPVMGILFVNIMFHLLLIANGNVVFQLYDQFPVFLGIVPTVAALFCAGIVITIASYNKIIRMQEEKENRFVEQQQIQAIQGRMEEVDRFYDSIRQMKHEMRNHLTNIKALVGNGSYEEIGQYIEQMDEDMRAFELTIRTGNAVTDVIVNDKRSTAQKQGIQFQAEFFYPQADGYSAYDIGIIINNLLQNALDACAKMAGTANERYICLTGRQKKKFYLIQVRNSFDGEVEWDTDTGLPLSSKGKFSTKSFIKEKEICLHGIGLSNVKRVVEQYMGDIDIRIEDGKDLKNRAFCVTVLLQQKRGY